MLKKNIESQKVLNFDWDVDKHKLSCTAGRDIKKWYSHFGEQFDSNEIKDDMIYRLTIPTSGYIPY